MRPGALPAKRAAALALALGVALPIPLAVIAADAHKGYVNRRPIPITTRLESVSIAIATQMADQARLVRKAMWHQYRRGGWNNETDVAPRHLDVDLRNLTPGTPWLQYLRATFLGPRSRRRRFAC